MLDKLKKEIKSTLKEEKSNLFEGHQDEPKLEGWIEALEYVMGQIDHFSKEEEFNEFQGHCPECNSDDLDNVSGGVDSTEMKCENCGHEFGIESKGWEVI